MRKKHYICKLKHYLLIIGILLILVFPYQVLAKNIVILATGGTIAGAAKANTDTTGYKAASLGVQSLIDAVPEIKKVANISGEQVMQVASQDMNDEGWLKLAKRVNELANSSKVDGIVITHGTDTIEETAYFLNLVIHSSKPIVLVGAMRPATAISADGPLNLYNAVVVANSSAAKNKGVLVVMNDTIFSARDVTKINTFLVSTFAAPNSGPLGFVQSGKVFFNITPLAKHTKESEFDINSIKSLPRVDIFYGYSNAPYEYIDYAVKQLKVKGIIIAGVGDGNLYKTVLAASKVAAKKRVVVVRSSRVNSGVVARNGEVNDDQNNFVSANSLNPQKARILLTLALTKSNDTKYIQKVFNTY